MPALKAQFCMFCGAKLFFRYPGGDPENGPAALRCSKDFSHGGPSDLNEEAIMEERGEIIEDFLHKMADGYREDPMDLEVPAHVRFAAETIQAHMHVQAVVNARWHYDYRKDTWERAPWYGSEVEDFQPTRRQTYDHLIRNFRR